MGVKGSPQFFATLKPDNKIIAPQKLRAHSIPHSRSVERLIEFASLGFQLRPSSRIDQDISS